jgi:serine/threonine-protein kinase RsbW
MMTHSNTDYVLRYRQEVPSRTEELANVRDRVEGEAIRFGFDMDTAFRLALAVDEACTNIIKHSYEGNPAKTFGVEIATLGNRFIIVLTDKGKQFDPCSLPKIDMKRYFEKMRRGGLGVHIMHLVMDDVAYDVTSSDSNQLRMVKYLNGEAK